MRIREMPFAQKSCRVASPARSRGRVPPGHFSCEVCVSPFGAWASVKESSRKSLSNGGVGGFAQTKAFTTKTQRSQRAHKEVQEGRKTKPLLPFLFRMPSLCVLCGPLCLCGECLLGKAGVQRAQRAQATSVAIRGRSRSLC